MSASLRKALSQPALHVGDTVGGYRIERVLHQSGASVVYRAHHELLEIPAVVKVGADWQEAEAEAEALGLFSSPHIPLLLGRGLLPPDQGAVPYLISEHVNGDTLSQLLRTHRRLGAFTAIRITLELLAALGEVHRHGVVHGDVKPDNIVIALRAGDLERAVLIDFGSARGVSPPRSGVASTRLRATPRYAAPEVRLGHAPSAQSDLFSLGCVLFEALSGTAPEWQDSRLHTPLGNLVPTPVGVADVVERALRTEPTERYANAAEFSEALLQLNIASVASFGTSEGSRVQRLQETLDTVDMTSPGPDVSQARASSQSHASTAANDEAAALLSAGKPSIWFCAGDPGLDQPQVRQAVEQLSEFYDVLVLDSQERDMHREGLTSGRLPWIIVFGDLHALLEEPLLTEAGRHGETSRVLVSTHENIDLLTTTINSSGLDAQICLTSDAEDLITLTHTMVERVRQIRVHYDGLRLAVRDARDDISNLQRCFQP